MNRRGFLRRALCAAAAVVGAAYAWKSLPLFGGGTVEVAWRDFSATWTFDLSEARKCRSMMRCQSVRELVTRCQAVATANA